MSALAKTQLKLVEVHGQKLTTNSLIVAGEFGRRHDNVLQTIKKLQDDGTISLLDCKERFYQKLGRQYPYYELNERSFLIAMPFIGGKKSRQGQVRLVDEFLRLKRILSEPDRKEELTAKRNLGMEMTDMLQFVRETSGKETTENHYRNEHRFCNRALTGKWGSINEAELDVYDTRLLAAIRKRNTLLMTRHPKQSDRRQMLDNFVADYRLKHPRLKLVEA